MNKEKKFEQRQRIGQQFRSEREAQGWSIEQVATMAGVTEKNVEKIEAGIYNVPFDVLARVADILGCELNLKNFINDYEVKEVGLPNLEQEVKDFCYRFDDRKEAWYNMTPHDQSLMVLPTFANFAMQLAKHFFELGVSCPINNINIEEVKAAAKAWSEDDENTRGCDYIGAVVAERAFVAGANWQEHQMMMEAKSGIGNNDNFIQFEDDTWIDLDPSMQLKPAFDVKEGEKVKVLVIKE